MVSGLREGFTPRRVAWLGLVIALALLSKTTCLALIPVAIVAVTLGSRAERAIDWRRALLGLLIIAAIITSVWGWWAIRNVVLYGDPLATAAFEEVFSKDRATPQYFYSNPQATFSPPMYAQLVARVTLLSLWGVFGQACEYMPPLYYALGKLLAAFALLGLLARLLRGWQSRTAIDAQSVRIWVVLGLMLGVVLAMFTAFNASFFQAQARYLFPANAALAAVFVAGLSGLAAGRWRPLPVWTGVAILAIMTVWVLDAWFTLSFLPFESF